MVETWAGPLGMVTVDFVREFQAAAAHVPLPEAFLERLVAESRKLPARVWRDALDGLVAFDDTRGLGRIAAPTLLLWGDRDVLVSRQEQERLAAAIPDARLLSYPRPVTARTGNAQNGSPSVSTP